MSSVFDLANCLVEDIIVVVSVLFVGLSMFSFGDVLIVFWLIVSCTTQTPGEESIEIRFREASIEPTAVQKTLSLVSTSHRPDGQLLSSAHQFLFTYLAQTDPAHLVLTDAHSQGEWRVEKIFILDDCVAVQLSEGHYLETLLFVQYREGWRLQARIRPQDHL